MATHSKPQYSVKEIAQLMKFYDVHTVFDLIAAQEEHIKKLQAKLPKDNTQVTYRVREG